MKILKSITAAVTTLALSATMTNAQVEMPMVSGYLIKADASYERVLVIGSNSAGNVFYKENANSVQTVKAPIDSFSGIWLFEPADFTAAKDLYEERKYQEAKDAFIALQERYKNYKYLEDSYYELSQFYEMECYRKLKDYETLAKKLELYAPDRLTRPGQVQQTKLYRMYDAVHKKDWSRLDSLCQDYIQDPMLTLGQRAQVSFCQGLAYEGLEQDNDALNAYATAMTADFTRSESIVRESALNSLRIFDADEEIKIAISLWGKPEEEKSSAGYRKLAEANALARLYDKAGLGAGVELPAKYKKFQKFTSEAMLEKLKK
ncbi:MAG: tetratricopeptide repeat protein [Akkermansiaceae bacterium]